MTTVTGVRNRVRQTIVLRPDQKVAVFKLISEDLKHGNVSRYFQDLVDADLAKRAADRGQEEVAS